jgi:hypothetical protein
MKTDYLQLVENKFCSNLDFNYLIGLREKLPYWNYYYFVCLAEALNELYIENTNFDSEEEVVNSMIHYATKLYKSANISDVFKYS